MTPLVFILLVMVASAQAAPTDAAGDDFKDWRTYIGLYGWIHLVPSFHEPLDELPNSDALARAISILKEHGDRDLDVHVVSDGEWTATDSNGQDLDGEWAFTDSNGQEIDGVAFTIMDLDTLLDE